MKVCKVGDIDILNINDKFFLIDIDKRTEDPEYIDSELQYHYKKGTPVKIKYDKKFNRFKYHWKNDEMFYTIPEDCLIEIHPQDDPEYFI